MHTLDPQVPILSRIHELKSQERQKRPSRESSDDGGGGGSEEEADDGEGRRKVCVEY